MSYYLPNIMNRLPPKKTGFKRIWFAFLHSIDGLRHAFVNETAFRQESFFYVAFLIILLLLPISLLTKCLLLSVNTLVLIVELLNSSIESVIDIASPDYRDLAKQAKDLSSAAVLISIILAIVMWIFVICFIMIRHGA